MTKRTKTPHTKTPWKVRNISALCYPGEVSLQIVADKKHICVLTVKNSTPSNEKKANAAFIVKAANSYEKMRKIIGCLAGGDAHMLKSEDWKIINKCMEEQDESI